MNLSNSDELLINAQLALQTAQKKTFPTGMVSTTFDHKGREDDTVKVLVLGAGEDAAAYDASTNNYDKEGTGSHDFVDVKLDQKFLNRVTLTPTQWKKLTPDAMNKIIQSNVNKLFKAQHDSIYALVLDANFSQKIVVGGDTAFDSSVITDILKTDYLEDMIGVEDPRVLLKPAYYQNLMEGLTDVSANGGDDVNVGGMRARPFRGLDFMKSNLVPANGENLVGFATNGAGLLLGTGVSDEFEGDDIGSAKPWFSQVFSTPEGFAYRMTINGVSGTKKVNIVFDAVWGVQVGETTGLTRLVSA
jgi:hypothetical protein|tara:strand:- start:1731 stop:2639 length:909 start_codon:yes stop_codon:yes gene_type:complete